MFALAIKLPAEVASELPYLLFNQCGVLLTSTLGKR